MIKLLSEEHATRIRTSLGRLYGEAEVPMLMRRFYMMLGRYGIGVAAAGAAPRAGSRLWDEDTVVLITYADSIREPARPPLNTLEKFLGERLRDRISSVHLLPFFPWSSDDGFSVIDFREVDESNGTWSDVEVLGREYGLMFDLVLNHCSRSSAWFRDFVTGIAPARYYFHCIDPKTDLSDVVRPRPWPLLTPVPTRDGDEWLWTTFSDDQIDLDWSNPDVLFEFLDILFLYISKGCRLLRLDAVAFLWKRIGTSCIHLPETHEVVKLLRSVVDAIAPGTVIITETNVPHAENISYFGDQDEAHMVYNFTLPPLLLHALLRGDSSRLTEWAAALPDLPPNQAFFNFTASHDGIGLRPVQDILPDEEINWLVKHVQERGGRISMRALPDGSQTPYEMNVTYVDALGDEDVKTAVDRFLCSQAVALSLRGVPAIYIHSLLGTPNDLDGVEQTGQNRRINRHKWDLAELETELEGGDPRMQKIFEKYSRWLKRRRGNPAFHPAAIQKVLDLGPELFAFTRLDPHGTQEILCLFNVTHQQQSLPMKDLHPRLAQPGSCRDILNGTTFTCGANRRLRISPYRALWLEIPVH